GTAESQQARAKAEAERDLEISAPLGLVGQPLEVGRILAPTPAATSQPEGLDLGAPPRHACPLRNGNREDDRADDCPPDPAPPQLSGGTSPGAGPEGGGGRQAGQKPGGRAAAGSGRGPAAPRGSAAPPPAPAPGSPVARLPAGRRRPERRLVARGSRRRLDR